MKFACPNCAKKYNLADDKLAARENVRLKCRQCGEGITVKEAGNVVIAALGTDAAMGVMSEAPPPLPTPPPSASMADTLERESSASAPKPEPSAAPPPVEAGPGLTPPLPPLTPNGAPPPPPVGSAPPPPVDATLAGDSEQSASAEEARDARPVESGLGGGSQGMETAGGPALPAMGGQAAALMDKFHGLEEQQRLWLTLAVGVVIGFLCGLLF